MDFLIEQIKTSRLLQYTTIFFVFLSAWWFYMFINGITDGAGTTWFLLIYPLPTLFGGIYGLIVAKKWGGARSIFGSALLFFALGFLAQTGGQYLYNYYQIYLGIDVPYPSIGDFSYLASVILYIIGAYQLARVAGIKLSVKSFQGKVKALIIPFVVLAISYLVLLHGYEADWNNKLIIFFDFGYPVGQAIYLSIALLALVISKDILGGMMRKPIILLILALMVQFVADFYFSYEASREIVTYYPAGGSDYIFALAYFLMTIALVSIGNMFYKVQKS